ncbi:MFS transporter [Rhodococcus corynebacterioides]|uniref:MFS transporter n=1 Tax=Rhodococcoides corynebacterioides TaxID=53972 RepID=A0ABS7P871_9NOCA|nr:MFS transporter [Rhodococcus corynebacterioides]MBY6409373.1 MFS transporter [Rhodococcus corynebacterioides]
MSRRTAFRIVAVVYFTVMASSSAPSPLYPLYREDWGFGASVLTVVFAVYALALLVALLVVGGLSDHIGRKPVVFAALGLLVVSLIVFAAADGVGWLIAARVLQGVAAGAATGALTAAITDLSPTPRGGPLVNSLAPAIGLAGGGMGAGLLVQFAPWPTTLVYLLLIGALLILAAAMAVVPESAIAAGFTDRRHLRRAVTPTVSLPASIRPAFWAVLPSLVATWSLGGFHLSLGPSIMRSEFGLTGAAAAGLDIFTLFTAGATGAAVASRVVTDAAAGRRVMAIGALVLVVGVGLDLVGLATGTAAVYFAGTAISGLGWGAAFLGAMRVIGAIAPPDDRAGVFSTTYVLSYLAFGLPAVVAGIVVGVVGLSVTATVYGGYVIACALGSVVATRVSARRASRDVRPLGSEGRAA